MKDFPMFTTEYGVASLVLREIPYRGEAYITIQDSLEPEKLLEECISFCRICGAEAVYAKGHKLDKHGNSVAGVQLLARLSNILDLSIY